MTTKRTLPYVLLCGLALAACGGSNESNPSNSWDVRTGAQQIPQSASIYGN